VYGILIESTDKGENTMKARPHTQASKKAIMKKKADRRAGNVPQLGIPPKGKGWAGKRKLER
jgi:hypothetical protein